ncbi:uncharacterized protein [Prorops nasuta]|uniref:uncharacterized protein n=1 Tax=Prorops nasuta TaxID=863751 RepID=UPI0034CD99C0
MAFSIATIVPVSSLIVNAWPSRSNLPLITELGQITPRILITRIGDRTIKLIALFTYYMFSPVSYNLTDFAVALGYIRIIEFQPFARCKYTRIKFLSLSLMLTSPAEHSNYYQSNYLTRSIACIIAQLKKGTVIGRKLLIYLPQAALKCNWYENLKPRAMLRFILLTVFINAATAKLYDYSAKQIGYHINSTNNDYIIVYPGQNGNPNSIEYKQDITKNSNIMVRVIFGNRNGPIHPKVANQNEMNICSMLENAIRNETSSQAKYKMTEALNLQGIKCPIKKFAGKRTLEDYKFPSKFTTNKDMGCGYVTFLMRLETSGSTLQEYEPLVELFTELELTKLDGC